MTENATITRAALARMIDHTLLAPEATDDDVARLAEEAGRLGVGAICISPSRLPLAPGVLAPGIAVAAVTGFPSGAHPAAEQFAELVGQLFDLPAQPSSGTKRIEDVDVAVRSGGTSGPGTKYLEFGDSVPFADGRQASLVDLNSEDGQYCLRLALQAFRRVLSWSARLARAPKPRRRRGPGSCPPG